MKELQSLCLNVDLMQDPHRQELSIEDEYIEPEDNVEKTLKDSLGKEAEKELEETSKE